MEVSKSLFFYSTVFFFFDEMRGLLTTNTKCHSTLLNTRLVRTYRRPQTGVHRNMSHPMPSHVSKYSSDVCAWPWTLLECVSGVEPSRTTRPILRGSLVGRTRHPGRTTRCGRWAWRAACRNRRDHFISAKPQEDLWKRASTCIPSAIGELRASPKGLDLHRTASLGSRLSATTTYGCRRRATISSDAW